MGYCLLKNLVRLYTVVTLYDQDEIANNFLIMYQLFNATVIPARIQPFQFTEETKALPGFFEYENLVLSTQGFIEDSQTTGLLVLNNGKIIFENYWHGHGEDKQHISFSVAKSFVSALMDIAIEDGFVTNI
jgi:hypothetical protein